jgi:hypothetical protein
MPLESEQHFSRHKSEATHCNMSCTCTVHPRGSAIVDRTGHLEPMISYCAASEEHCRIGSMAPMPRDLAHTRTGRSSIDETAKLVHKHSNGQRAAMSSLQNRQHTGASEVNLFAGLRREESEEAMHGRVRWMPIASDCACHTR